MTFLYTLHFYKMIDASLPSFGFPFGNIFSVGHGKVEKQQNVVGFLFFIVIISSSIFFLFFLKKKYRRIVTSYSYIIDIHMARLYRKDLSQVSFQQTNPFEHLTSILEESYSHAFLSPCFPSWCICFTPSSSYHFNNRYWRRNNAISFCSSSTSHGL